jgi:hypothetical protein
MSNPLQKYFRQPAIYTRLPSEGNFWPPGSIELSANGELAVYPMTARDELIYKTPDALMNGQSTVDVIQSCIPQIRDAWQCPAIDLDAILVAIRIASNGNSIDFEVTCPKCSEKSDYTNDLTATLGQIKSPDFGDPVVISGLEIYLKPQNYHDMTQANLKVYQEQKMLMAVNDSTLSDEDKIKKFTEMFRELTDLTVQGMAKNIRAIKTDQDIVTESTYIMEFLSNCGKSTWDAIDHRLQQLGREMALPDTHIDCPSCGHGFETPVSFDPSSFFA